MRVITGTAKGMRLVALEGDEVRPTYDRVKEAIFSIIQFDLEGRRVLDLFAGSGQLGIEALSRGAQTATFVDSNRSAIAVVKENLDKTRLSKNAVVLQTDAVGFIKNYRGTEFDVVLLDPPYHENLLGEVLPYAAQHTSQGGVIVCESASKAFEFPEEIGDFVLCVNRKYSHTIVGVYRHRSMVEGE